MAILTHLTGAFEFIVNYVHISSSCICFGLAPDAFSTDTDKETADLQIPQDNPIAPDLPTPPLVAPDIKPSRFTTELLPSSTDIWKFTSGNHYTVPPTLRFSTADHNSQTKVIVKVQRHDSLKASPTNAVVTINSSTQLYNLAALIRNKYSYTCGEYTCWVLQDGEEKYREVFSIHPTISPSNILHADDPGIGPDASVYKDKGLVLSATQTQATLFRDPHHASFREDGFSQVTLGMATAYRDGFTLSGTFTLLDMAQSGDNPLTFAVIIGDSISGNYARAMFGDATRGHHHLDTRYAKYNPKEHCMESVTIPINNSDNITYSYTIYFQPVENQLEIKVYTSDHESSQQQLRMCTTTENWYSDRGIDYIHYRIRNYGKVILGPIRMSPRS